MSEPKTTSIRFSDYQECASCGRNPLKHEETGQVSIAFYEIQISQALINVRSMQRFVGLTMMLGGNAKLAEVMGADDELARKLPPTKVILCQDCFIMKEHHLGGLWEGEGE